MLFFVGTYRPSLIWPSLIVSLIFGSGLMPFGLTVVDEVMVGSLMLGILFVWVRNKNKEISPAARPVRDVLFEIHRWVFVAFTLYLVFQCARGMIVMDSFRKVRWVVFFVVLGVFSAILDRNKETAPDRSRVALWVANSTTLYLAFYLIHGVTAQFLRGMSWADLQCKEMGTTAYSIFAVALGAPAALILLRDGFRSRWWGELCLVTMFLVALYYDSRVAVIVLLGFLVMGLFYVPWPSLLRVGAIWTLSVFLFGFGFLGKKINLQTLSNDVLSSGGIDRVVQYMKDHSKETIPEVHPIPVPVPETVPSVQPATVESVSTPDSGPAPSKASTFQEETKPFAPSAPKPVDVKDDLMEEPVAETEIADEASVESVGKRRYFLLDPNTSGRRAHDIDRIVHAEVVLHLLAKGGAPALFGYGYRMSGRVISPILRELYSVFMPEVADKIKDDESTEMFTAWVADTGAVGLVLLMGLFVLTGIRIYRNARGILGLILVTSSVVCFFWTLVINISDVFLIFFAVLPSGILVALSRPHDSVPTA